MGEHRQKKGYVAAAMVLECATSVSILKIVLVFFVKFLLFFLRIILSPLGLVWLWGSMLRNNVYRKYPRFSGLSYFLGVLSG